VKKKILIIGNKSLLSLNIKNFLKSKYYVKSISFLRIKKKYLLKFNFIINCNFNDNISDIKKSSDYIIANFIKKKKIILITISSGKVYGTNKKNLISENKKCNPVTKYGRIKHNTEKILKKLLKNKLLILRVSNIIQFDIRKNVKFRTFINIMLRDLKNKRVITIPKNVFFKDFLPLKFFNNALIQLIDKNIVGVYNVGSGIGLKINDFARLLIKGYGSGKLIKVDDITDNLVLNVSKLKKIIKYNVSRNILKKEIVKIGRQLKHHE
jgi:dTDP-4-dehydrorhamnose reductase